MPVAALIRLHRLPKCSVMGCMLGCVSWPNCGIVPSSVLVTSKMEPMKALHLVLSANASPSVPSRYFCVDAANAAAISSMTLARMAQSMSHRTSELILDTPNGRSSSGLCGMTNMGTAPRPCSTYSAVHSLRRTSRMRTMRSGSITLTQSGRFVGRPRSLAKETTNMPEDRHSWTSSQMPVHSVGGYAEMRACPSSSAVTTSMEKQYLSAELTALPTRVAILLRLATEVSRPSKSSSSGHVNPSKAMWSRMTSTHL